MDSIELHSAYVFSCGNCGRENLVHAIEADLDEPSAQAIIRGEADGLLDPQFATVGEKDDEVEWIIARVVVAPMRVRCGSCQTEYEVELPAGRVVDEDDQ